MRITALCTNREHPVLPHLRAWCDGMITRGHEVLLAADRGELTGGDVLFLVSCSQIIRSVERATFTAVLVLHASDLPKNRGMSPHVWSIVEGASEITVCLLEAADPLDTGDVWLRRTFTLEGHELLPEINEHLFAAELALMTEAVDGFGAITPSKQVGDTGPMLARRTPEHSRLDPNRTIADQFDLLRVVDNDRYPAFMDFRGCRYLITIVKAPHDN